MYYDQKESGKRIAALRKEKGMTQEQLAEKLNISYSMMAKIEIGNKGISIDLLIELTVFFDVSMEYIILGHELHKDNLKEQYELVKKQFMALGEMI